MTIEDTDSGVDRPLHSDQTPREWVQNNLFSSALNSGISVVSAVFAGLVLYFGVGWALNVDWEIVRANLRNFMIGQFPKDELWRPWAGGLALVAGVGVGSAGMARNAFDDATDKGLSTERPTWIGLLRRFWPILAFIGLVLTFTRTIQPTLGVLAGLGLFVAGRVIGWNMPQSIRRFSLHIIGIGVLALFTIVAGSGGLVAVVGGIMAASIVSTAVGDRLNRTVLGGKVSALVLPALGAAAVWLVMSSINSFGYGWKEWGGLYLTLFVTVAGISTGMPLGILLAIGRRSQLPVVKGFCVMFIEFIRGVPLISLLFFSGFMLPLLFPPSAEIPDGITRAMIVITLFSAAYIAEIVRGGLQAVPQGQIEAAQAQGLSTGRIQRLIVMPQALRAVIPAMVGQFISLFKDTSLLAIIGVAEFLQIATIANTQQDFLGKGLQPITYTFVAVGYWAFAYTMSKESRRLETRLGVGTR
jgi:general L-amino acid transport system permease protein